MRPRSPGCGVNVTVGAVDRYRPGGVTSAAGTTCVAAAPVQCWPASPHSARHQFGRYSEQVVLEDLPFVQYPVVNKYLLSADMGTT